jgi:beta-lactam-binding protein with PASTA domain
VQAPGVPAETVVEQSPRAGSKVSSSIALKVAR